MELAEQVFNFILNPKKGVSSGVLDALRRSKLSGLAPDQLKEEYKIQWLLNQAYLDEVSAWEVPDGLEGTLLKGMDLISRGIYTHPGQRFMGDVDLLISKEKMAQWGNFLERIGYRDITKETWEANNFKKMFLKVSGTLELVIELHTRLFYQEEEDFSWQLVPHSQLSQFTTLTPEDLFIHLCGHLAYQHTFISLHWLYDIYLLVSQHELSWSLIRERAQKAQVLRSCQLVLKLLRDHFKLKNLPDLDIPSIASFSCAKLITREFLIDPANYPNRYFLVKHLTKDHLSQALAYDLNWFKAKGLDRVRKS